MANDQPKAKVAVAEMQPLVVLVGAWDVTSPAFGGADEPQGRDNFEWMAGGHYLIEHSRRVPDLFPDSLSIIGYDPASGNFLQHYFDSRGVERVYNVSLADNVWRIWREAPGFSQRYSGTFNEDRTVITGQWEKCTDGTNWELD